MAEDKSSKPMSIRLNDDTKEKFRKVGEILGYNQNDTMTTLINAYEMQQQQDKLPEFKGDLEQFQSNLTTLLNLYTVSLQSSHDMRESVRTEFDALLKSKDVTIADLQTKVADAKQVKEAVTLELKETTADKQKLLERVDQLEKMLADKDGLNKALTDSCNELKVKVDQMIAASQENAALKKKIADLNSSNAKLQSDVELKDKLLQDQQKHEADVLDQMQQQCDLEKEKAILELEKQHNEEIQKLKSEKQSEVDNYQQKYMELLEKLQKAE
jgi:chromosome segregation ATPase